MLATLLVVDRAAEVAFRNHSTAELVETRERVSRRLCGVPPPRGRSAAAPCPLVAPCAAPGTGPSIVVLKYGAPSSEALVQRHALSKALKMDQHFGTVLHGFSAAVGDEDLDSLRSDPDVESVTQDRFVHQFGTETGMGWALDRVDQKLMPLNGAFAYGATGAGVNLYWGDGGMRSPHPEVGGRARVAAKRERGRRG